MTLLLLLLFCAATEEISAAACDDNQDRLDMARLYNEVNASKLFIYSSES